MSVYRDSNVVRDVVSDILVFRISTNVIGRLAVSQLLVARKKIPHTLSFLLIFLSFQYRFPVKWYFMPIRTVPNRTQTDSY